MTYKIDRAQSHPRIVSLTSDDPINLDELNAS